MQNDWWIRRADYRAGGPRSERVSSVRIRAAVAS